MIELRLSRGHPQRATKTATPPPDAALTRLQAAHGERLRRFCLRLCNGSQADADDLVQETWCAAHEGLPRFRGQAQVTTWLFRIAVYRWRQMRQAAPAVESLTDDATITDSTSATLDRLALADALLTLPDVQREAFLLVKAEQFTHREAAAILQVPQGTVQARVHEAVHRLRVLLSESDNDNKERTDV